MKSFAAVVVSMCALAGSSQAGLVYQWNFNASDGTNTGSGSGGTLATNVGPAATTPPKDWVDGSFNIAAGVSGLVGDKAYQGWNSNDSYWGNFYSDAAGIGNVDMSSVNQFTITMWVKRGGGNNADVLNIGSSTTPDSTSNPGISIGLNGAWDNGIRLGVNGYNAWCGDLWSAGTDNDWVFLAIAYDATDTFDVWNNATMNGLYGQNRNVAIMTGDTVSSTIVDDGMNLHVGDWWTPVGGVAIGSTATAFLGNNGPGSSGFSGQLDDVRIYNSLLTVSEIDAVRVQALPEPASLSLLGLGAAAMIRRRRSN